MRSFAVDFRMAALVCIDVGVCHSGYRSSEASASVTSERVRISGRVIYRWKARDDPISTMYKTCLSLAPFLFKMAAKMADFRQKYINSYTAGYIEAILQIENAKLTFLNTAGTGLACLKQLDCFRAKRNSKRRPK